MSPKNWFRVSSLIAVLVTGAAFSAPPSLDDAERPWAMGVSEEDRQAAMGLFQKGNQLLKDGVFVQAAARYREALERWDHPAIHYNLVLALLNLDQPVEVLQHLEAAMKHGPAPLDLDKYEQARAYKKLVEGQLARIEVHCEVAGAQVVMDGRPLFVAPGSYTGWVRAGPHTIVATAEGFLTNETSRALPPGKTTTIKMELFRTDALTRYRRRWSAWVPWSIAAAGAAVAATGALLHTNAAADFQGYDEGINACGGCVPGADLTSRLERAQSLQTAAIGGYVLGGAALAAGATMIYLNRPEPYRVTPEQLHDESSVAVFPIVAPGAGGMSALIRF